MTNKNTLIQLKITLDGSNPAIWRRVLVPKHLSFSTLHLVIQIAMGWENRHLFMFQYGNYRIELIEDDFEDFEVPGRRKPLDAREVSLQDVISEVGEVFSYEYDFGDCWRHSLVVEQFVTHEPRTNPLRCIDGALNCPPEDCGGIPGFYDMLKIVGDKRHREYKETLRWLGGPFDAAYFDKEEVNEICDELFRMLDDLE